MPQAEGLDEILGRAGLPRPEPVGFRVRTGQDELPDLPVKRMVQEPFQDLVSRQVRKPEVHQQDIRHGEKGAVGVPAPALEVVYSFFTIPGPKKRRRARLFQHGMEEEEVRIIILGDQDDYGLGGRRMARFHGRLGTK